MDSTFQTFKDHLETLEEPPDKDILMVLNMISRFYKIINKLIEIFNEMKGDNDRELLNLINEFFVLLKNLLGEAKDFCETFIFNNRCIAT